MEVQISCVESSKRALMCLGNVARTTENLVTSLATKHHLNTHCFDLAAEEIHGCARTHSRNIVCLEVVDHVWDCVKAFLDGESVFVMYGA